MRRKLSYWALALLVPLGFVSCSRLPVSADMLSAGYEHQGLRPDGTKGVANPCLKTIGFEIRWDESQRMTHPLLSVLCYLLSTKPSTDPLPCGTPPNLEGEFLVSICTLFSVLCSLFCLCLLLINHGNSWSLGISFFFNMFA